jgi:hypothetical protein
MNNGDLIAIPYVLVRVPLAVLDSKVVHRLPDDSPSRLIFDRQVGSLDRLMRRMLEPNQ